MLRFDGIHSTKEFGVVAVAGGGQDVVSDNVPDGTPREDVYDVEADGVVRLEEADVLLGPGVAGLEVGQPVLLRQPLLRHVLPLEVEEYEPPQEQRQPRAQADHHRRVQLRPDCSLLHLLSSFFDPNVGSLGALKRPQDPGICSRDRVIPPPPSASPSCSSGLGTQLGET
ncbi:hypothetical protein Dimus_036693 [Dionaea muscipula]